MALNQVNLKGVMYAFGTEVDITAASGSYVLGRRYIVTSDGFPTGTMSKVGTAFSPTLIKWDVTQSQIDTLTTAISDEATRAQAAEGVIATDLANEITRATTAEGVLTTNLANEVTRATDAEATLLTAISNETAARQTGDSTNATAISDEAIARANADTTLQFNIDLESTARADGDSVNATAISNEVTARQNAIATEATSRDAADVILQGLITDEATIRASADTTLQSEIDAIDTAYKAADSTLQTQIATDIAALAAALRDERVTDYAGVTYTANQSMTVSSLLGSTPLEGIHIFKFNSADINNTATVTGLPGGASDVTITYNDVLRVVVDGGVATSVSLVDDALKTKFDSVDSSISALETATTASAIRAHISATGFVTFVNGVIISALSTDSGQDIVLGVDGNPYLNVSGTDVSYTANGITTTDTVSATFTDIYSQLADVTSNLVQASNGLELSGGDVVLGGALTKATEITGSYELKLSNSTTKVNGVFEMPIWSTNSDGSKNAKGSTFVEMWFSADGVNYVFPN